MTSIFQAGQPFNIVRTSSTTYQANDKDLVISSGDEVALPSPNQGATILVRPAPSIGSVKITTSNGTIGNTGETFGIYRATEPIYLVGDGTDWYARSGGGEISAIPDVLDYRWPWDDDSNNTLQQVASGGSLDGTLQSGTYVSGVGSGGFHINFDPADNDYADVTYDNGELATDDFTLLVWANLDNSSGSNQEIWRTEGNIRSLTVNSGSMEASVIGGSSRANISASVSDNTWYFFAFVGNNTDSSAELLFGTQSDTELTSAGTDTYSGGLLESPTFESWGRDSDNGDDYYDGQIDHPAYATTAMIRSDVQAFFDATKGDYS